MAKSESISTICVTLKLRPTCAQAATMRRWLWHLTAVYNWAIKRVERDAQVGVFRSAFELSRLLNGHSQRLGIPVQVLRGTTGTAHQAWRLCFDRVTKRPKLKGRRRPLNSIAYGHGLEPIKNGRVLLPGLGRIRFYRQDVPAGHICGARAVKRASGWHLVLFVKAQPNPIARAGSSAVGIDPGFLSLLTLSNGEVLSHPRELQAGEARLAQAQLGGRKHLAARLNERIGNRRKNRNHHLSRRLVAENALIAFSLDASKQIARKFGKSVASAGHHQLRSQLRYKSLTGGAEFIEVPSRNSTRTCSACGALTGPAGLAGLKVRFWVCACGAQHDRDVNAAINTLKTGLGMSLKRAGDDPSGIAA